MEENYVDINEVFGNDTEPNYISDEEVNELKEIYDFYCSHEDLFYVDDEGYLHYKDADANLVPENVKKFLDNKLKNKKEDELIGRFL